MANIVTLLGQKLGEAKKTQTPGEWRFDCPKCRDGRYKFYFNSITLAHHCFACNYAPGFRQLIADLGITYGGITPTTPSMSELEKQLASAYTDVVEQVPVISMPSEAIPAWDSHEAMMYLQGRMAVEDIHRYGVHYCATGFYRHRVIFPVQFLGQPRGFVARTLVCEWCAQPTAIIQSRWCCEEHKSLSLAQPHLKKLTLKYLYPQGMTKSRILWNFDVASRYRRIIVTEGIFDALHVGEDAVATFGKSLSETQRKLLLTAGVEEIVFFWDRDAHADMRAAAERIYTVVDTKIVFSEEDKDPGDMLRTKIRRMIDSAVPWDFRRSMEARLNA